jgi:hypothetical protein
VLWWCQQDAALWLQRCMYKPVNRCRHCSALAAPPLALSGCHPGTIAATHPTHTLTPCGTCPLLLAPPPPPAARRGAALLHSQCVCHEGGDGRHGLGGQGQGHGAGLGRAGCEFGGVAGEKGREGGWRRSRVERGRGEAQLLQSLELLLQAAFCHDADINCSHHLCTI